MNTNQGLTRSRGANQHPPTPSLTKRKQVQEKNIFRSPTDSMLSPCSQRLMKQKHINATELQINKITVQQIQELTLGNKENEWPGPEQRLAFGSITN